MSGFFDRALQSVLVLWPGRRRFRIVTVEELPERLKKNKVYAIGAGSPGWRRCDVRVAATTHSAFAARIGVSVLVAATGERRRSHPRPVRVAKPRVQIAFLSKAGRHPMV